MTTLFISNDDITPAADIIKNGGVVGVPTETVYGLAANGLDAAAVQKIYDVKNRPETKPISLLVTSMKDAENFCRDIPAAADLLAEKFWPGPLTMILFKKDNVPPIVTAGGETVGVRCPDHPKTLALIAKSGVPLATPSANLSGAPSLITAAGVFEAFDGKIEAVVDGGPCAVGVASTIVDLTVTPFRILRCGGLPPRDIETALGLPPGTM
ncbi:threonylcarbamoyl-AMP synthase [Oscillospiraceae bacterium CM]|nr:threonylcarbamoyl-AMP synthase [Oscillospiraceae bacterium CM]